MTVIKKPPNTKINLSTNIYHTDTHRGTQIWTNESERTTNWNWNEIKLKKTNNEQRRICGGRGETEYKITNIHRLIPKQIKSGHFFVVCILSFGFSLTHLNLFVPYIVFFSLTPHALAFFAHFSTPVKSKIPSHAIWCVLF